MIVRILAVTVLALGLIASAGAQTKGPNGGIVMKADDHLVKFVQRGQEIVFYLGGPDGKPLSTKGLQALALVQDGGKITNITLAPTEPNSFVGKLAAPVGTKARIVFSTRIDGQTLQARFVTD